eukprot:scaffold26739_cov21-Tisochrysis_lutea.AAC.3
MAQCTHNMCVHSGAPGPAALLSGNGTRMHKVGQSHVLTKIAMWKFGHAEMEGACAHMQTSVPALQQT